MATRKLSMAERRILMACAVCGAGPGVACDVAVVGPGMARISDGTHLGRLYATPMEVDVTEGAANDAAMDDAAATDQAAPLQVYIDWLNQVKASGPEWSAETRLHLVMANVYFMQQAGVIGCEQGVPNATSLLMVGGTTAEELEAMRAGTIEYIDNTLLPFFRDGGAFDLVDAPEQLQGYAPPGSQQVTELCALMNMLADRFKDEQADGRALTDEEQAFIDHMSAMMARIKELAQTFAVEAFGHLQRVNPPELDMPMPMMDIPGLPENPTVRDYVNYTLELLAKEKPEATDAPPAHDQVNLEDHAAG